MFSKLNAEEKAEKRAKENEEYERPRWVLSQRDTSRITTTVVMGFAVLLVPMLVVGRVMEWLWPAIMAPDSKSLWALAAPLSGLVALLVTHWFTRAPINRWWQAKEVPADEELQDRLQTVMVPE